MVKPYDDGQSVGYWSNRGLASLLVDVHQETTGARAACPPHRDPDALWDLQGGDNRQTV